MPDNVSTKEEPLMLDETMIGIIILGIVIVGYLLVKARRARRQILRQDSIERYFR